MTIVDARRLPGLSSFLLGLARAIASDEHPTGFRGTIAFAIDGSESAWWVVTAGERLTGRFQSAYPTDADGIVSMTVAERPQITGADGDLHLFERFAARYELPCDWMTQALRKAS